MEYEIKKHNHAEGTNSGKVLFLDQASRMGFSIWEGDLLLESGIMDRAGGDIQEYGHAITDWLTKTVEEYSIELIFYEEVFVGGAGSVSTAEKLYYIKHRITDFGYESRTRVLGIDNTRWKKYLSDSKTFSKGKLKSDKDEILRLVQKKYPDLEFFAEDEVDAIGMGIAVMVNKGGNYYGVSRYNKKLPMHWGISGTEWDGFLEDGGKLSKKFKNAINVGGVVELELDKGKALEDNFRKFLSYEDVLAYMVIPKSYKYWGYYGLLYGENPKELPKATQKYVMSSLGKFMNELDDGTYIIYGCRKKRL